MMFKRKTKSLVYGSVGMFDLASIGIIFGLAICIGYFGGKWIGGKLGNETAGWIVGFVMGVAAAFMEMFRAIARWNRQLERQEKRCREEQDGEKRQS